MEYAIVIRRGFEEISYEVVLTDDYEKATEFVKKQYEASLQELELLGSEAHVYTSYYTEDHAYIDWKWVIRRSVDIIDIEIVEAEYIENLSSKTVSIM